MEFQSVGILQFIYFITGLLIFIVVPIVIACVWKFKKKERFTTILAGAGTFLLFALILEKPIQNVMLFPTAMGLPDHPVAQFINARPLLLAFLVGLFPGLFEETGRLVAYLTVLKKRRNRETSISFGIGHGGFEVILILGLTYFEYIMYAVMINSGAFAQMVQQVAEVAPDQVGAMTDLAAQLANYSLSDLLLGVSERIFAVLFHVGASIMVFYALKSNRKFWLYPLAIVIHTIMDFIAGLVLFGVVNIPTWGLELIIAVIGLSVFFFSYYFLYRLDHDAISGKEKP